MFSFVANDTIPNCHVRRTREDAIQGRMRNMACLRCVAGVRLDGARSGSDPCSASQRIRDGGLRGGPTSPALSILQSNQFVIKRIGRSERIRTSDPIVPNEDPGPASFDIFEVFCRVRPQLPPFVPPTVAQPLHRISYSPFVPAGRCKRREPHSRPLAALKAAGLSRAPGGRDFTAQRRAWRDVRRATKKAAPTHEGQRAKGRTYRQLAKISLLARRAESRPLRRSDERSRKG